MSRGYLQQNIFLDDCDKGYFLKQVMRIYKSHGLIIHSYCLMTNHFHLLAQNPLQNLAKAMHLLLMRYARYFNRKYNRRGKVFESQYLAPVVCTEEYLTKVCKYIHRNPLDVIVQDLSNWKWSSYPFYINNQRVKPAFLETRLILSKFSIDNSIQDLMDYTLESSSWKPEDCIFHNTILGSEKFIEKISLEHIDPIINTDVIDSYKLNLVYKKRIIRIKKHISELSVTFKEKSELLIFALKKKTNLTYKEISKLFFQEQAKPATLSDKFNRLLVKASNNKELAALLFNIEIL
jgi:REP element-mobilizing transposase RayT